MYKFNPFLHSEINFQPMNELISYTLTMFFEGPQVGCLTWREV